MDEKLTVSVVIPYNPDVTSSLMLLETTTSVNKQSIDTTTIVVNEDEMGLDEYRGPAWARNIGLKKADTKYVAFLDADDIWTPDKLKRQINLMNKTGAGICVEGKYMTRKVFFKRILAGELHAITSSILIDTEKVNVKFEESLFRMEDHLFMIEAAQQAGICFCPNLVITRKHEKGLSANTSVPLLRSEAQKFEEFLIDRVDECEEYLPLYRSKVQYQLGRLEHFRSNYKAAINHFIQSIGLRFQVRTLGALIHSVAYLIVTGITFD